MRIRLATRGSVLAWTQSGHVADALRALGHEVDLVRITTHGDVSAAPLVSLGGVGVFVGAVREAVLDGRADIAVHSLKDLPTPPAPGLLLAAVPPREDPADALCTRGGVPLSALRSRARVGTGSPVAPRAHEDIHLESEEQNREQPRSRRTHRRKAENHGQRHSHS